MTVARPGGTATFLTPRHSYGHTWILQNSHKTLVRNSLAFVLEAANIDENGALFGVLRRTLVRQTFDEGRRGVDRAGLLVTQADGWRLFRMVFFDFRIDRRGRVDRIWRNPVRVPSTFTGYRHFLDETVARLVDNGKAAEREFQLHPLVAVSRGYDSTAVAALLRRHPATRLATLDVKVTGTEDGGQAVAAALNMPIHVHRHVIADVVPNLRFDFTGRLAAEIGEFIATAGVGDDVTFKPFEPILGDSILSTGGYGDSIWSMNPSLAPGLAWNTPFSKGINEFRLRVGFAHVPVPVLGARFNRPIKQLSADSSMLPWSVGGEYDRPIPRRIAEEAGVPRELFGQQKAATAPLATNHDELFPAAMRSVRERYRASSEKGDV